MVVGRRAENCAIECSVLGEGWFEWKGGVLCAVLKATDGRRVGAAAAVPDWKACCHWRSEFSRASILLFATS